MKKNFLYFVAGILLSIGFSGCRDVHDRGNLEGDPPVNMARNDSIRDFWEHFRKGTVFRIEKKWAEAATEFGQALLLNPRHEDALFYLGNMYYEMGIYEDAEKCWKKLAEENPLSVKARFQLGNLYCSPGRKEYYDLDNAEREFLEAHRINKVITGPQMRLGQIMLIRDNPGLAGEYFRAVLGSDTRNIEASLLMGYISWKTGDTGKAYTYYTAAESFAAEKKPVRGTLSEGDTRAGKAFFTPVEQSLFRDFLVDLGRKENLDSMDLIENRYGKLDRYLDELRGN